MDLKITSKNIKLTEAIRNYIEEKMAGLEKMHLTVLEADMEIDKNTHHRHGEVFNIHFNFRVPHDFFHLEVVKDDLYAGIDECREEAERQLRKYKTKFEAKKRRAQKSRRVLKSFVS